MSEGEGKKRPEDVQGTKVGKEPGDEKAGYQDDNRQKRKGNNSNIRCSESAVNATEHFGELALGGKVENEA